MNKLLSTIENDEALLELFYPYFYVSEKEKDKTILDYGCSYGWGSSYLAKDSKMIVGYDIDSSRIDYANNEYEYLLHSNGSLYYIKQSFHHPFPSVHLSLSLHI